MLSHQFLQAGLLNFCAYVPMTTLKGCTAGDFGAGLWASHSVRS